MAGPRRFNNKDKRPKRNTQSLLFKRKRFCRFTVTGVEHIDDGCPFAEGAGGRHLRGGLRLRRRGPANGQPADNAK